jgi:hypothetical protein
MLDEVHHRDERSRPDEPWIKDHWTTVTAGAPCAVCGASEGCTVMCDEPFLRCAEQPSEWPMTGGGWLHHVAAPPASELPVAR